MFPVGYTWALVTPPAISLSLNGRMVVNSQGSNLQQSNQMYILAAVRSP